ncbi:hypothetical protein FI667_g11997, partial [Globisporangium splendens]
MSVLSNRVGLLVVFFLCVCVYAQWSVAETHSKGHLQRHRRDGKHKSGKRFGGAHVKRPEYYGSGCPPSSLSLVNSSDETSFAMTIMFADFQAATLDTKLRDQKKCFINVELSVEPTFASGFMDDIYEAVDFDQVAWTPCGLNQTNSNSKQNESHWIRIESTIIAEKALAGGEDVQITIDSSDSMLAKGVAYEVVSPYTLAKSVGHDRLAPVRHLEPSDGSHRAHFAALWRRLGTQAALFRTLEARQRPDTQSSSPLTAHTMRVLIVRHGSGASCRLHEAVARKPLHGRDHDLQTAFDHNLHHHRRLRGDGEHVGAWRW